MAVKPILTEEVIANVAKKNKNQGKKEANKAFLGFMKAKELISAAHKVNFHIQIPTMLRYTYTCTIDREKPRN
jgi:hypothetical protein